MKGIPLTQGKVALVDDEDYWELMQLNWTAVCHRGKYWYAITTISRKQIGMHSYLLPKLNLIDHIDGNGLNNQKSNLRSASRSQNMMNSEKRVKGYSSFKGVSFDITKRKWCALIQKSGKRKHLGYFKTEEEAARAYDIAAKELFGEYARLNSP